MADLIAAFVKPKGGDWSTAWAQQTARAFDKLTIDVERKLLLAILSMEAGPALPPASGDIPGL